MKPDLDSMLSLMPENPLEETLTKGKAGQLPVDECVRAVLDSPLYVPSKKAVQDNGDDFVPLVLKKDTGEEFIAAFTSLSRVNTVSDRAKFCVRLLARLLPI